MFPTTDLHENEEENWEGCSFHDDREIIIAADFLDPYVWQYKALYGAAHAIQSQKAQTYGDTCFLR